MTGAEFRAKREALGLRGDAVAWVAGISSERLRAIEREPEVDQPTAERIERSLAIFRGMKRRIARQLIETARNSMRQVAGVR